MGIKKVETKAKEPVQPDGVKIRQEPEASTT
jgi:hypothetical protein